MPHIICNYFCFIQCNLLRLLMLLNRQSISKQTTDTIRRWLLNPANNPKIIADMILSLENGSEPFEIKLENKIVEGIKRTFPGQNIHIHEIRTFVKQETGLEVKPFGLSNLLYKHFNRKSVRKGNKVFSMFSIPAQ